MPWIHFFLYFHCSLDFHSFHFRKIVLFSILQNLNTLWLLIFKFSMVEQYLPTFKFHDNIDDVCHDYDDDQHDKKGDVLNEAKIMSHQLAIGFFSKPHLSSSGGLSVCETVCQCLCMPVKVCRCVCVRGREDNQELKVLLHLQIIRRAVSGAGQLTDGDLNSLRGVQNVS